MSKSKCTCKNRPPWSGSGIGPWNYTHDATCYYAEVRKQEAQAREDKRIGEALYRHYRREARKAQ